MTKTVLAVDDSPSIRCMVALTLREAGYEVIEASDGQEALDLALSRPVDAILTDQNMPRLDGLGFIRASAAARKARARPSCSCRPNPPTH